MRLRVFSCGVGGGCCGGGGILEGTTGGGDDGGDGSLALDKGFTTAGLLGILGTTSIIWVVSKAFCAVADVSCSLETTTPLGLLDSGKGFTTGSAFGASGTAAFDGALPPDALAAITVVPRSLGTATPC